MFALVLHANNDQSVTNYKSEVLGFFKSSHAPQNDFIIDHYIF